MADNFHMGIAHTILKSKLWGNLLQYFWIILLKIEIQIL